MQRLDGRNIGVDQGETHLFSDYEDGGAMWTGSGPREVRKRVTFSASYRTPPSVSVALSMWDMDQKTNARAEIQAEKVSTTGFEIVFKTWADTRIARVRASWMAIGELPFDDDWELY
ncbi:ATP synthase [Actibacterium mucosum KCTC 23349]|uniref:ATP synthase n=1 Tax=Actibacterium mucosum KCTC 23349 TaxID=1454373 RepID=A0A037ZHV2_9RHOB|nr:H-type lectin domain-containing protein [Actibacterium mucosum]KAJ55127.1 ATP synthase [Actibacterium mucosum KCTC 23349]